MSFLLWKLIRIPFSLHNHFRLSRQFLYCSCLSARARITAIAVRLVVHITITVRTMFVCLRAQTTASEATFVALLAARSEAIKKYRAMDPDLDAAEINARLVGYCSDQVRTPQ